MHITALMHKKDDFENRLQCNNLLLLGVPETAEGFNPGDFLDQWLASVY